MRKLAAGFGAGVFQAMLGVNQPRFFNVHVLLYIVDVPVFFVRVAQMATHSCFDAARAEGAADIDVVSGTDLQPTPAADFDLVASVASQSSVET